MDYCNFIDFKISIIGDSNVGKTCIIKKFIEGNKFDINKDTPNATMGIEYYIHSTSIDGKKIRIKFEDTIGTEKYRSIVLSSLRGADGLLIVFDLNCEESFDNIIYWVNQAKQVIDINNVEVYMIGNKCDLERKVTEIRIENFKRKNNLDVKFNYFETSALTGNGINECMLDLFDKLLDRYKGNKTKNQFEIITENEYSSKSIKLNEKNSKKKNFSHKIKNCC